MIYDSVLYDEPILNDTLVIKRTAIGNFDYQQVTHFQVADDKYNEGTEGYMRVHKLLSELRKHIGIESVCMILFSFEKRTISEFFRGC